VKLKDKILKPVVDFMLSCEKATFLLSKQQHQKLSPFQKLRLRIHLAACDGCVQFGKQIIYLSSVLEKLKIKSENLKVDEKFKADIQSHIDNFLKNEKKD